MSFYVTGKDDCTVFHLPATLHYSTEWYFNQFTVYVLCVHVGSEFLSACVLKLGTAMCFITSIKDNCHFLFDPFAGIQSFCRDLVEVADILEQAVNDAEQKGMRDASEILCSVEKKLQSIFTKHGLQKMTPVGGDYDPYDHEIVSHVPAEGRRLGSVATIEQDGYKLHGRTIRHAHVGIAVEKQE